MRRIRRLLITFGSILSKSNFDRMLFRVRVTGESCWPVLVPGKSYWASALAQVRTGDFIVFRKSDQLLIKKILEARADGYRVGSTVSWGSSSRDFGIVGRRDVLGKII